MSDNNVTIVGNVTDDPELRYTEQGVALATFSVAVSHRTKDKAGEWVDQRDGFFRCTCWRELAENVAESLKKGMRVVVTGRLKQDSFTDSRGESRQAVQVTVDDVGPSLKWATAQVTKTERKQVAAAGAGSF